jgi:putative SOS response-associated peptidase YedK
VEGRKSAGKEIGVAPSTAAYHDRTPLVLDESKFEDWMRERPERAAGMMTPYAGVVDRWQVPSGERLSRQVHRRVTSAGVYPRLS